MKYYMIKFLEVTIVSKSATWYHSIIEHWWHQLLPHSINEHHKASVTITLYHRVPCCIIKYYTTSIDTTSMDNTDHHWAAHCITEHHRATLDTTLHHWVLISLTMVSMILLPFGQAHKSMCGFWILSVNSRSSSSLSSRTSSATCIYRYKKKSISQTHQNTHILLKHNFQYMYMYSIQVFIANKKNGMLSVKIIYDTWINSYRSPSEKKLYD